MCERHLRTDRSAQPLRIDQCLGCEGIWLDGDELRSVAEQLRDPRVRPFLDEPMRSPSLGLWLFMFFTGLPIEAGNPRVRRPVVTSDLCSMPEAAGGAACLVDPYDVASIRQGVLRVMGDAAYRDDLVARGWANVERFRADRVAARYAQLYRAVAAGCTRFHFSG